MSAVQAGRNLIFLISQPRAGSTLLQRMLGAHPDVHTTSEPWIALHPCMALHEQALTAVYDHTLARTATAEFLAALPDGEATYARAVGRTLSTLYDAALASSGKRIFLDKTPRYYFIVPDLARILPEARVVFLFRNPLAVLSSILETWVCTPSAIGVNGFWHDLLTAPSRLLDGVGALGNRATVVHYERLVVEPQAEIQRVSAELGLSFHPDMVDYGRSEAPRFRLGDQGQIYESSRPVTARAERWSEVLRRFPIWHALGHAYLERLGPSRTAALGYDVGALADTLGSCDDSRARAFADEILAAPRGVAASHWASDLAHRRNEQLEAVAAERLAIMEEQTRAIAAFQSALTGREAELAAVRAELADERSTPPETPVGPA